MPRRSTSGTDESPAPRRASARIAAAQTTKSPVSTPSPAKKAAPKRQSKKLADESTDAVIDETKVEANGSSGTANEQLEPAEKKTKIDDTAHPSKSSEDVASDVADADKNVERAKSVANDRTGSGHTEESGFEVVDKLTLPSSESEEVRAAITAQGEDGHLLVNFVQVSKDEIPAPGAPELAVTTNDHAVFQSIPEAKVISPEKPVIESNGIDMQVPHTDGDKPIDESISEAKVDVISATALEKPEEMKTQDVEAAH